MSNKISIVIPLYNEAGTIYKVLEKIFNAVLLDELTKEVIIVDCLNNQQVENEINRFKLNFPDAIIICIQMPKNKNSEVALQTGIKESTGTYITFQNADLAYNPEEYNILLKPVLDGFADIVYGSRFIGGKAHHISVFGQAKKQKIITFLSNLFTNLNLSDINTCFKLFKAEIIKKIELTGDDSNFEIEITAKLARIPNTRIYEVGISSYENTVDSFRSKNEKNLLSAIFDIIKYNLLK